MPRHWAKATCTLVNPYTDREHKGHSIARQAFAPVYGKGDTPEAAEADAWKWVERRIKKYATSKESKYAPFDIGTPDDWTVGPFIMPEPKFKVGERVWKVRRFDGRTIPAAKREVTRVRFNADHPGSVGTFCTHVDNVGGLGFAFMADEKDYERVPTAKRKRR